MTIDLTALKSQESLQELSSTELEIFAQYLETLQVAEKQILLQEGSSKREMFFLLSGQVELCRGKLQLGQLSAGQHVGELGLITGRSRSASIRTLTPVTAARLSFQNLQNLQQRQPALAFKLQDALISRLGVQLTHMTDSYGRLLQERSLPRHLEIKVCVEGQGEQKVPTGTPVHKLLPHEQDGFPVVAALLNHKMVSLNTPLMVDAHLKALSTAHWEGERIFRHSAALLLQEAAHRCFPGVSFRMMLSVGGTQWLEFDANQLEAPDTVTQRLQEEMEHLIAGHFPFRHEQWSVEEALSFFEQAGRQEAAALLQTFRSSTVSLVTCGEYYVLSTGPLLPDTSYLKEVQLFSGQHAGNHGLALKTSKRAPSPQALAAYARVMEGHDLWLKSLNIHSIGHFNRACLDGRVTQLIRVAEGFHEKRLSQIADLISARHEQCQVVCIAGPSSSGKTTFIRRLSTQLQVNGLVPATLSLDDYYRDRTETPLDDHGEYDFEALEALRLDLLVEDLRDLIAGKTVRTARYDFQTGLSDPEGGPELTLNSESILLLEGIHGLNPRLLADGIDPKKVFRVFTQPMASLSFDEHSRINPSDLRLLRRIVRDRHQRATSAAESIMRWSSVRAGEQKHIFPFVEKADVIFDTSLIYELSVLKIYAERYLLEIPREDPAFATGSRLQQLIQLFVSLYPDPVPPTSILREFIGKSGFEDPYNY